jgi:hypothetical protein
MIDSNAIRERFAALSRHLRERDRRLWAASEARAAGYGGIAAVSAATGIAASTIGRGLKELASADTLDVGRVRRRVPTAGEEGRDSPGRLAGAGRSE